MKDCGESETVASEAVLSVRDLDGDAVRILEDQLLLAELVGDEPWRSGAVALLQSGEPLVDVESLNADAEMLNDCRLRALEHGDEAVSDAEVDLVRQFLLGRCAEQSLVERAGAPEIGNTERDVVDDATVKGRGRR